MSRGSSGRSDSGSSSRSFSGSQSGSGDRTIRSSDIDRSSSSSSRTFRDTDRGSDTRSLRTPDATARSADSGRNIQGPQQYEARRPTDNNVRDFLNQRDSNDRNPDGRSRDFDRNRSPRDRDVVDREYKQWQNTSTGNKGDGRDHRDWTGSWKNSDRFTVADQVRRDWNGRRDRDRLFDSGWWSGNHRGNYWNFWGGYASHYNRPWYWWSWATGPRLASWIAYGWPTPYYWDYGRGEYIYCDDGVVYVNGRWYEPAPAYYDQTVRLIEEAPVLTAESAAALEWMPLGVFAVTPDGKADANVTVQLAVTKDGVIGGTAFDPHGGTAYNIQGTVDKRSQRAVWSYHDDGNQRIVMETSIYNLTQPEATGMVHYSPTDMRVVELVRLQQPDQGPELSATLPAPPATR